MSDDLIKRSDAIKATWQEPTYTDPLNVLTEVRDRIEVIPSAERPQGEWINGHSINGVYYKRCDQCFAEIEDSFFGESSFDVNYCPNCGARMKGTENNKECHKPESLYYRAFCEERKNSAYCDGCEFWH